MQLRWDKLIVRNFLAINEAELELNNQGLVLIEGINLSDPKFKSNGAGKSSLVPDALSYVLYNITTKGLQADDVVNNKIGKNTEVILVGTKGEDTYRIERYRKHSKHKNKVRVYCNDKELTEKSAPATNKLIEDIVGIPHTTFINSILFAQKDDGLGSFALLPDSRKKEVLDSVLKLEIYSIAQIIAKDRVKAKDAEVTTKQRDIEKLEWQLGQVDVLEQQDKQQYQNTLNVIQQEQKNLAECIKQQNDFPAKYFGQVEQAKDEIVELTEKKDSMTNIDISAYQSEATQAQQQVMATRNELDRLNREKEVIKQNYKKVQTSTNCPVCGSDLDPTHRNQEMASLKEQLLPVMLNIQSLSPLLTQQEAAYQELYNVYLEKKAIYDNALNEYRKVEGEIQKRVTFIQQYENQLQNIKNKAANVKRNLDNLMAIPEPQPREKDRENIRQQITAAKHELVALEQEKLKLETAVKVYSNEGVKSHVLDLFTPKLNERGNKYLAQLAGSNMELNFSTRTPKRDGGYTEKFDVQLTNRAGGDMYKANSAGEKRRADLSIALALQDLVIHLTNVAVYDEFFDGLDEVGVENAIALLEEKAKVVGTIFVITHNAHFSSLFEKKITIVKDANGISTLQKGKNSHEIS
ncbi:exonuclease [Bacillus phage vB_BanH_Emiliahah]|nr:exonuclease [Bacillus phage vB_BanH_Emiliahah]